jgi:3-oxoacyl-[acyl-carrier protein] reductase
VDLGIAGKAVLCAGGSKGMGLEAARMLAAEGCQVAIIARTKPVIDEAVASIAAAGGTAIGISADLTRRDDVVRAVAETCSTFGPPLIAIGQTVHNIPGPPA